MSDDEKTYEKDEPMVALNPHKLPYASNVGAPVIRPGDNSWKFPRITKANHYFDKKYDELKKEFEELINSYEVNVMIYNAEIHFEPVLGYTYHLYERKDETIFLSLISPDEWPDGPTHIGSYIMDVENRWHEVDGY